MRTLSVLNLRLLLLALCLSGCVHHHTDRAAPTAVASSQPLVIGIGDDLELTFRELFAPEVMTVKRVRVDRNGEISIPLYGGISAAGLTPKDLAQHIDDAYRKSSIDPTWGAVSIVALTGKASSRSAVFYPGDELTVTMSAIPVSPAATDVWCRIDELGEISVPLIGKIPAAGLTPQELADRIKAGYELAEGGVDMVVVTPLIGSASTLPPGTSTTKFQAAVFDVGDELDIQMGDLVAPGAESMLRKRVDPRGDISMPLVGRFSAIGLTPQQLADAIQYVYYVETCGVGAITVTPLSGRAAKLGPARGVHRSASTMPSP